MITDTIPLGYDAGRVARLTNKEISDALVLKVHERVSLYYPEVDARSWSVTCIVWGGQETARTFRVDLTSRTAKRHEIIYVKLCPIFESLNPSRLEYETLQLLYAEMPKRVQKCSVSRPLDFYPELNAYAMESVGEREFKTFLLRNNSRFKNNESLAEVVEVVEGCGTWLATFHNITVSASAAAFTARSFVDGVNHDFNSSMLSRFAFSQRMLVSIEQVFRDLSILDDRYEMPCAKWHWDYTPGHIFLDNGNISVIDILGMDGAPIYEDIGRFLAAMATINNLPFHPFFDHERADTYLSVRFLEAYRRASRFDGRAYDLFSQVYKLKYLIIWFCGQHFRVSSKIHPMVGKAFANVRLVRLFEPVILRNIAMINASLKSLS